MTDSFLEEFNGSLSWVLHYVGAMCNGYSGNKIINVHQNKGYRLWLGLDSVKRWVIKAAL